MEDKMKIIKAYNTFVYFKHPKIVNASEINKIKQSKIF